MYNIILSLRQIGNYLLTSLYSKITNNDGLGLRLLHCLIASRIFAGICCVGECNSILFGLAMGVNCRNEGVGSLVGIGLQGKIYADDFCIRQWECLLLFVLAERKMETQTNDIPFLFILEDMLQAMSSNFKTLFDLLSVSKFHQLSCTLLHYNWVIWFSLRAPLTNKYQMMCPAYRSLLSFSAWISFV